MKKILIISSFILVLISISTIGYNLVSASEKVDEIQDIISFQENKEIYITPYGYTLDNPNIILDPYGISPLTAIILFETKEDLPVTVTIQGKDQNSTYTNTFESSKKHYLPIYGLYPNTINKIHITCGNQTQTFTIETSPLPNDLTPIEIPPTTTNNLTFITTNNYPYALDNNNDVRWYLTKKTSQKITYLDNGHLLLNTNIPNNIESLNNLIEIDLLGKIYKQYLLDSYSLKTYTETPTSLFLLSNNLTEIEKQTGTILNTLTLEDQYNEVFYDNTTNTLNLSNTLNTLTIDLETKEQTITNNLTSNNETTVLLSLHNNSNNYQITKSIKFDLTTKTPTSNKNIFLIGYIKPDETYNNYNINIIKTADNLQITGTFKKEDKVYLILDKFLDKKIYNITTNHTIINKTGLSGKYSIYISINNTIYKTNTYIKF